MIISALTVALYDTSLNVSYDAGGAVRAACVLIGTFVLIVVGALTGPGGPKQGSKTGPKQGGRRR